METQTNVYIYMDGVELGMWKHKQMYIYIYMDGVELGMWKHKQMYIYGRGGAGDVETQTNVYIYTHIHTFINVCVRVCVRARACV